MNQTLELKLQFQFQLCVCKIELGVDIKRDSTWIDGINILELG